MAVNAGIRWNSANQKAGLVLKADDIFNSMQGNIDIKLRNRGQYMDMHNNSYSRHIMLTSAISRKLQRKKHEAVDTSRFK